MQGSHEPHRGPANARSIFAFTVAIFSKRPGLGLRDNAEGLLKAVTVLVSVFHSVLEG
jgi:hypothetical protein